MMPVTFPGGASVPFVFRRRGHDHLFAPEVPEGRHVEGHVGEHHQVLEEGEQGVDCRAERQEVNNEKHHEAQSETLTLTSCFTELVVASEEVSGRQTAADVKQEETQLPTL